MKLLGDEPLSFFANGRSLGGSPKQDECVAFHPTALGFRLPVVLGSNCQGKFAYSKTRQGLALLVPLVPRKPKRNNLNRCGNGVDVRLPKRLIIEGEIFSDKCIGCKLTL